MYLRDQHSGNLVEVLSLQDLADPCCDSIPGRFHVGEELQEPAVFDKSELRFPSDEGLPRCWIDPHYRGA
jgi:hypothetical protein